MSSEGPELTTTSYAILGLLAIRPWATYELAKQMQRDLHYFWPRAESNLYAEPKKLVARGLAQADSQPRGQRRRTVYSITPAGRSALTAWLDMPAAEPRWESETIVKLVFATNGSREQLLERLRQFREQASARREQVADVFEPYLEGNEPFPDRTHVNILAATLVLAAARTETAWAEQAIREVERWPTATTPDELDRLLTALHSALNPGKCGSFTAGSR